MYRKRLCTTIIRNNSCTEAEWSAAVWNVLLLWYVQSVWTCVLSRSHSMLTWINEWPMIYHCRCHLALFSLRTSLIKYDISVIYLYHCWEDKRTHTRIETPSRRTHTQTHTHQLTFMFMDYDRLLSTRRIQQQKSSLGRMKLKNKKKNKTTRNYGDGFKVEKEKNARFAAITFDL